MRRTVSTGMAKPIPAEAPLGLYIAVRTVEDLLALVEETEIGSDVVLRVMRGADASKLETVRVKTVDRAQLR